MADLKDRIVLVTGAGKGTGRRVAEAFAACGAVVAANDVSPVNLDETVANILAAGGRVKAYVEDIAKKMPIQGLLNSVLDDFERIDILVNCAEVEPQKSVLEMDDWDWQRTLDVNLTGAFLLTQSTGRIMKKAAGSSSILARGLRVRKSAPPILPAKPGWRHCLPWQPMNCPNTTSAYIISNRMIPGMWWNPRSIWSCPTRTRPW